MDNEPVLPPWIVFLLIALAAAFAVFIALILSQMDALQQRTLLPQPTLPVVDLEATIGAGELTIVVMTRDDFTAEERTPISTPTLAPTTPVETPTIVVSTVVPTEEAFVEPTAESSPIPLCADIPDDWAPYIVQEGDTLLSLATLFNISMELIAQVNCLAQLELLPGQIIFVPAAVAPTISIDETCGVPPGWVHHVIKPDETLASIAHDYHTTVIVLMYANCLDDVEIIAGRKIFVPAAPVMPTHYMPAPAHSRPCLPAQSTSGWSPNSRPQASVPMRPTAVLFATPCPSREATADYPPSTWLTVTAVLASTPVPEVATLSSPEAVSPSSGAFTNMPSASPHP